MGYKYLPSFKLREVHRENQRRHEKCSVDRHAFDADDGWWKRGAQIIRHKHWVWYRTGYRKADDRSQVSVLWNCGLWAHIEPGWWHSMQSRRKVCQRIACQQCRQQYRYQEQWTKRTIFLLVNTRQTNWQSSRPGGYRDVINNGNKGYWRGSTSRCLHKQGIIVA